MYTINTAYWDVHIHVHKYIYKYSIYAESDTHYPDNVIASISNDKDNYGIAVSVSKTVLNFEILLYRKLLLI